MFRTCRKCGKRLSDPESIARGYGPECWAEIVFAVEASLRPEDTEIPGQLTIWDIMKEGEEDKCLTEDDDGIGSSAMREVVNNERTGEDD